MNATTNSNWYFNGEYKYGENPLADLDQAEQVEAEVFVEKFKQDAPAGFEFSEPSEEQPFGSWTRKDDKFGGTTVILQVATGSDSVNYEYPDLFEMLIYAGEGMELKHLPANWETVDQEIRDTLEAWSRPNPYSTEEA